jgi:Fe-S cluster assembly protein SufD
MSDLLANLPGRHLEAWHYTDLKALKSFAFAAPAPAAIDSALLPDLAMNRIVFVNGFLDEALSVLPAWAQLSSHEATKSDLPLAILNAQHRQPGIAIDISDDVDAGAILLISISQAGAPIALFPRHRISLGRNAKLTLIDIAQGEGVYWHNPVGEISLADAAQLSHYRLQDEAEAAFHTATIFADIAASAAYESFSLVLGGQLSRAEFHARLGGMGADIHLNAAQLLAGTQHADFTSVVSHDAPHCASRQTVKSVLAGHSRGVFQGRIEVARAAQKTDGYQMNQALLLSPHAEIDSKPELEIFADDVKCSHGATIGALDPEQIFYLRSRGIPEPEARAMLIRAFIDEALAPVTHDQARALLERAIEGAWSKLVS